ncbi:MAG: proline dehydrogenase family protein, partial [Planctomycetales bacterium]|nr:proline dehydrogenase family protein [Planctomycetales bacterium]
MFSFFPHRAKHTQAAASADLESVTLQRGQELLAGMRRHNRRLAGMRKQASDRLLDWAMGDASFKTQLFRYVDVFPTLNSPELVHDVLLDYLHQPNVVLPPGLGWGLKAGGMLKGSLAKTVTGSIERMADSFIAGANVAAALPQLARQWQDNIAFSVDLLGEASLSDDEADAYLQRYLRLIVELDEATRTWPAQPVLESDHLGATPRVNVSVKISSLSAHVKPEDFAGTIERLSARIAPLLNCAAERGVFVNFDMEQSAYKDLTIALFQRCCEQIDFSAGIAIQAYLRSGPADATNLIEWAKRTGRQVTVRLIKGAYWDYELIHAEEQGWPVP